MAEPPYRRVIIKLSGEALVGPGSFGIHQPTLERIATDVVAARGSGVAIGIVIGGGNIFRGVSVSKNGIPRATGDMMGMLATVMNGLALESALQKAGASAHVMSALAMPGVCESYERGRALRLLARDHVLVFSGGIGNPFFTTDTTAVLRAAEIGADAVFKATDVDGVYSADPKKDGSARRYEHLTHGEAIARNLKVMDITAFALARECHMPIIVFSVRTQARLVRCCGERDVSPSSATEAHQNNFTRPKAGGLNRSRSSWPLQHTISMSSKGVCRAHSSC